MVPEPFLTPAEKAESAAEAVKLDAADNAAEFLSSIAVGWAVANPEDPRNPEALALAVRTSHFGCGSTPNGHSVERAFRLLHQKYPETKWAAATPYWY